MDPGRTEAPLRPHARSSPPAPARHPRACTRSARLPPRTPVRLGAFKQRDRRGSTPLYSSARLRLFAYSRIDSSLGSKALTGDGDIRGGDQRQFTASRPGWKAVLGSPTRRQRPCAVIVRQLKSALSRGPPGVRP